LYPWKVIKVICSITGTIRGMLTGMGTGKAMKAPVNKTTITIINKPGITPVP
jgi:hypothetical protein